MQNEKETKEKLLQSAKTEFLSKGYSSASLRTICKNAGVTTGALYFFFKDKEDLFASLVQKPLEEIERIMIDHYNSEAQNFSESIPSLSSIDLEKSDDFNTSLQVIKLLYSHYDEMILLITKSQGSRFENCLDNFVNITEKHYARIAEMVSKKNNTPCLDPLIVHWISHAQIEAFAYLLTHATSEEQAQKLLPNIIKYLTGGWYNLYKF